MMQTQATSIQNLEVWLGQLSSEFGTVDQWDPFQATLKHLTRQTNLKRTSVKL